MFSRRKDGKGKALLGFGEARKSEVELFERYLGPGSLAFRVLSGYVHSKPWIWLRRDRARASATPGVLEAQIDLDAGLFAKLLNAVIKLHEENIGQWLTLAGHGKRPPKPGKLV